MSPVPVRTLFVCIGNSCRSPMAEGFARSLGAGVLEPASAGLFPARIIQPETFRVMGERGVRLEDRPPQSIHLVDGAAVDLVVNMAPTTVSALLSGFGGREVAWKIVDPIGQRIEVYRAVRDEIEAKVKELIEEARNSA